MEDKINTSIYRTYTLDYLGKYHFYEEDELLKERDDGSYILENLKQSNRFDYDGASYTFTKFGNVSEGRTQRAVPVSVEENNINVKINDETIHLDLIYKMDIKELEDHIRITTRISEKGNNVSCLLYINLKDANDFIKALEGVKEVQQGLAIERTSDN